MYDLMWMLVDYHITLKLKYNDIIFLLKDLVYSGIFSIVSLSITNYILNSKRLSHILINKVTALALVFLFANTILAYISENFYDAFVEHSSEEEIFDNTHLMGIISSIVSLIHSLNNSNKKLVSLSRKYVTTRMETLKSNLSPHFIFNCLSVLSYLIEDDTEKAEQYTIKLSNLFRITIGQIEQDFTKISQALNMASLYINMIKERNPNISMSINENLEIDGFVISMGMQTLIENAIKHNPATKKHKLMISVYYEDGYNYTTK